MTFRTCTGRVYRPNHWTSRTLILLVTYNRGYFQTIRIYDFRILGIADTSCNLITVILQSSIIYPTIVSYNRHQLSPVITLISLYIHLIYSHHITLTSCHIIHYLIHHPVIHYPLPSLHTLSFTYHIHPPFFSCPTTQLSYLLFIFSLFISSPLFPYFLIPSHFLSYHLYLSISLSISLISIHFLISLYASYASIFYLSHISPTYFNLNILYITHMRDNISPYLSQFIFTPPYPLYFSYPFSQQ